MDLLGVLDAMHTPHQNIEKFPSPKQPDLHQTIS